ncbi:MAG: thioesterase family protein [Acidobacteriota bacterium]|nr:MAG: thioesterase family protein [Acidobacteriota bacterium]
MLEGLRVGDKAEKTIEVTRELTIQAHDPNLPPVYSTPAMIYLMEVAAAEAMRSHLPEGGISVGVEINVRHAAPTPIGDRVTARATVLEVVDNLVKFEVEAHDNRQLIGSGEHTRAVLDLERFVNGLKRKGLL